MPIAVEQALINITEGTADVLANVHCQAQGTNLRAHADSSTKSYTHVRRPFQSHQQAGKNNALKVIIACMG